MHNPFNSVQNFIIYLSSRENILDIIKWPTFKLINLQLKSNLYNYIFIQNELKFIRVNVKCNVIVNSCNLVYTDNQNFKLQTALMLLQYWSCDSITITSVSNCSDSRSQ